MSDLERPCADFKVLKNEVDHIVKDTKEIEIHVKSDIGDLRQCVGVIDDEKIPQLQLTVAGINGALAELNKIVESISGYIMAVKKMFNRGLLIILAIVLLSAYPVLAQHVKNILGFLR